MEQTTNSVRTRIQVFGLFIFLLLIQPFNLIAQSYVKLNQLKEYQTKTYYSNGAKERAKKIAQRCDNVVNFYRSLIDFEPSFTLLVLSKADWAKYGKFQVVYGMPYAADSTLFVASEDNDFWKSFIPNLKEMPKGMAQQISRTYSDSNGTLTMLRFFDLLAIHELGHVYSFEGGLNLQRRWMSELFANVFLHTYIAENEPQLLPTLTNFPRMVVNTIDKKSLKYTTLNDFETNYDKIYPKNYGWYQCRLHIAAANIYNEGNTGAFEHLWKTFKKQKEELDDTSLVKLLSSQVDQSAANVLLNWDK